MEVLIDILKEVNSRSGYYGKLKEAERVRDSMMKAKGIVIEGRFYPPILGKGYIHDRFSCDCGFTDKSGWQAMIHRLKNLSHKMRKNW